MGGVRERRKRCIVAEREGRWRLVKKKREEEYKGGREEVRREHGDDKEGRKRS